MAKRLLTPQGQAVSFAGLALLFCAALVLGFAF
jgi:hypothetical protein